MTQFVPRPVWAVATAQFVAHLLTNGRFGVFRDELYYLACADHLAWGYVDHPPFSIAVLAASRALLGDSVQAIRIVPALLGVLIILGAARLARRFGGGPFAQTLAAIAAAVAPGYLANTGFYSMNAFDLAFWMLVYVVLDQILQPNGHRAGWGPWMILGAIIGLGLLNKLSVGILGLGLLVAIPAMPKPMALLRQRKAWVAVAVAALLVVPHVIWQIQNEWPTREFVENAKRYKIAEIDALDFLGQNTLDMLPPSAPLWIAGLIGLLFWPRLRSRRWIGVSFVAIVIFFVVQSSKPYYLYPAFLPLFAAGAVAWESMSGRAAWRWVRPVWIVSLLVFGALASPLAIPVLSPAALVAYQQRIGLTPSNAERSEIAEFSQHLADRFGWSELATTVAGVYRRLPPDEQTRCIIVASNYGEAGALRYFGRALGLPPPVSQHNNFYLWGPGVQSAEDARVVLVVNEDADDLRELFESVTEAARSTAPYAMPFERNIPVHVCRGWKIPLDEVWRAGRMYI